LHSQILIPSSPITKNKPPHSHFNGKKFPFTQRFFPHSQFHFRSPSLSRSLSPIHFRSMLFLNLRLFRLCVHYQKLSAQRQHATHTCCFSAEERKKIIAQHIFYLKFRALGRFFASLIVGEIE
jgi:hypothetical protein